MDALFHYLLKVFVCSGVMFLYYQLFLKDKTFHHYNRFYLLITVVVSLLLPLIKIEYFTIEVNEKIYLLLENFKSDKTLNSYGYGELYSTIVFSALGLVSFFFIGRLFLGIVRIEGLKKEYPKKEWDGIHFYLTNLSDAPFSFFRNLFWKENISLQSEVGKQILKHEMVHIEQKHSWDKIFLEFINAIFWMNPIFYLIKKEIFLIHEYLADHKAVKKSDTQSFAKMLLASHFSGNILPGTSPFIHSNLKKRIKMLQKPNTKFSYARRILALPVVFTLAFAYLVSAKNKEISEVNQTVEKVVETMKMQSTGTIASKDLNSINDTILPPKEVAIVDLTDKKNGEQDPFGKQLGLSSEDDIFVLNGKKVKRDEFLAYFKEHQNQEDYIYSQSASKAFKNSKVVYSVSHRKNEESIKELRKVYAENNVASPEVIYLTKSSATAEEREALRKKVLENYLSRKDFSYENQQFFDQEEKDRKDNLDKLKNKKEELENLIINKRNSSQISKILYPGRNYEKSPLTVEEIALIKEEAQEIQKEREKFTKKGNRSDMGIFRMLSSQRKIYDLDGNEVVLNEKLPNVKTDMMVISTKGADLYVNGNKVSRDEFMKYQVKEEDFKKEGVLPNIQLLKEERVGNKDRSYLRKLEIITNDNRNDVPTISKISINGNSDIKIYIDDVLASREEMNRLNPSKIEKMNVIKNKEDRNKGEIRITTKK